MAADVVLTLSLSADVIVTAAGTFRNGADVVTDRRSFRPADSVRHRLSVGRV